MLQKTIDAITDHGAITGAVLSGAPSAAQQVFEKLEVVGIDMTDVFIVPVRASRSSKRPGTSCSRKPRLRSTSSRAALLRLLDV